VAATAACAAYDPLSFSVLDTLRRLSVIVVCGMGVRRNPTGVANVLGTLIVLVSALLYQFGCRDLSMLQDDADARN
jgi:hypothetical protein